MTKIKLLKFRTLNSNLDFKRIKEIISSGKFWCSKLWNLNDPMEGVYSNFTFNENEIDTLFEEKNELVICSFSSKDCLKNPLMWGYYANGFKGVVIEIEIEDKEVKEIKYNPEISSNLNFIEIITNKLDIWKPENEYRYLKNSKEGLFKIGEIKKIYFGNPYGGLTNTQRIIDNSSSIRNYNFFKKELELICEKKKINIQNIICDKIYPNNISE